MHFKLHYLGIRGTRLLLKRRLTFRGDEVTILRKLNIYGWLNVLVCGQGSTTQRSTYDGCYNGITVCLESNLYPDKSNDEKDERFHCR